jgi:hypothetical protein
MSIRAARTLPCVALSSGLLLLAAFAPSAVAANRQRLQVTVQRIAGGAHGTSRPVTLHFRLSRWTDDGAISSPAAADRFSFPPGFALDSHAVRYCTADALAHRGPAACSRARVGSGTLQLAGKGATQTLSATGRVIVYNSPPSHGHATLLTYAVVEQPSRNDFWFQSVVTANRHGTVIAVRETHLSVYGLPLTVLTLNFDLGRTVGHGAHRRSFVAGPATCGRPSSRIFGLQTTFYDRFIGQTLDRPAGPPLSTAEPASC